MKIGQVARETGLSVKTLRYYHDIGLVAAPRGDNGYRAYGATQLSQLQFVARSKALGFSLEQCAALLALNASEQRTAGEVRAMASEQLGLVREKLAQLQSLERRLSELVGECRGGTSAHCSILDSLNGKG
ncbi:MerR family DNA-binding transcriptional regulator [Ferrimonas sediminicola]|uniref:HTH-type transcriptional regulator CueR n=1 Tax=Ferrimonas sediminicola TaxID=2569538 RepID=A0A4U1BB06_9GAMM|nr:MerR family transcriptional regulator [Ferrimonas sediminicola]TKB47607.1 MerR family DNA-binding transcriptional regulator [Ferrimonas sediminicola]